MSDYYYFRKNEQNLFTVIALVSMVIFYIFAYAYILTSNILLLISFVILFLIYVIILFLSEGTQKVVNKALMIYLVIGIYGGLLLIWIFDISYHGIKITDDKMLVFVTLLYVYLTYKITKSNIEIAKYQKIPQIMIDNNGEISKPFEKITSYTVENISDYPAKSVFVTMEVVYPIPTTYFASLVDCLKKSCEIQLFTRFKRSKPTYITCWKAESIEPHDNISVTIEKETINSTLKFVPKEFANKILEMKFEPNTKFEIIIKCEYFSQDGISIETPVYKLFEFDGDSTGIRSMSKSGIPKLVQ
jgi:hypothetical protein